MSVTKHHDVILPGPRSAPRRPRHSDGTPEVGGNLRRLRTGDAILFTADVPHADRNVGQVEGLMYLAMAYAEDVG